MNTEPMNTELNEIFAEAELSATEVSVEDAGAMDMDSEIIDLSDDDLDALEALDEDYFNVESDDNDSDTDIIIDNLDITE